jgi:hypothetical protein
MIRCICYAYSLNTYSFIIRYDGISRGHSPSHPRTGPARRARARAAVPRLLEPRWSSDGAASYAVAAPGRAVSTQTTLRTRGGLGHDAHPRRTAQRRGQAACVGRHGRRHFARHAGDTTGWPRRGRREATCLAWGRVGRGPPPPPPPTPGCPRRNRTPAPAARWQPRWATGLAAPGGTTGAAGWATPPATTPWPPGRAGVTRLHAVAPRPRARAAVSRPRPRAGRAVGPRARQVGHQAAAPVTLRATTPGSQAGATRRGRERGGGGGGSAGRRGGREEGRGN